MDITMAIMRQFVILCDMVTTGKTENDMRLKTFAFGVTEKI